MTEPLLEDLSRWREETPGCSERIHFNNAGAALMPRPVLDAVKAHLDLEARIGGYEAARAREEAIATFYHDVGSLVGGKAENIAFAGSATLAYSQALSSIPFQSGDVLLTTRNDYISNQIAFLSLRKRFGVEVVRAPDRPEGGVDVDALVRLLERRPRVVAVTHVPTNSGLVQPIAEIGRACREREILYLVDACQSLGQLPIDVSAIGCDFLSATGRKFLRGPRGTGFLYVSDRALKAGYEPLFIDMRGARWTGPDAYIHRQSAKRFEDWESAWCLVLGCAEAARYATAVSLAVISPRALRLASALREKLAALPRIRILDRGGELSAIVTLEVPGVEAAPFLAALEERGINGNISLKEYAILDFGEKQVEWALRLSPHYYNTVEEVEVVVAAIGEILGG
jgi:selenocysteine lyase/cysteine desulfurase